MIKLFRNLEIKSLIISFALMIVIIMLSFFVTFDILSQDVSRIYIKQNTILLGEILEKHPELEEEVIGIYTKDLNEMQINNNYLSGKKILEKYKYTESLEYKHNKAIGSELISFRGKLSMVVIISLLILFFIVLYIFSKIFNQINKLALRAEKVNEGDFSKIEENYKEGDFFILITSFNNMIERLKASMELIKSEKIFLKNIISDITHQYKTPLASLIMFNELMIYEDDMSNEEIKDCLMSSREQLSRMEWLTLSMLKLTKLESKTVEFYIEDNDIKETIGKIIETLEFKIKEKNIDIVTKYMGKTIFSYDEKWLNEALTNIIKNSIEHSRDGEKVEIIYEESPITYTLKIKDYGEGIPKDEIYKVFERFYKGRTSNKGDSIGIGLSLAKSIIEGLGGNIKAESEYGKWTCFKITFYKGII